MTTGQTENGITTLTPAEGYRLTNGETIAEGVVYLGTRDSAANWREITVAEAEALAAEQETAAETAPLH